MSHRLFFHGIFAWFLLLVSGVIFSVSADEYLENSVKALFISNLPKFVEWSDDKSVSRQSKIDICVLGDGGFIDAALGMERPASSKLAVSFVREKNLANIPSHCHMLFINQSEGWRLEGIINSLKGKPVLTLSDSEDFAKRGVMMGVLMDESKVKIIINNKSVKDSGLYIDAGLLEAAFMVIR